MAALSKIWVAHFYERKHRGHPFATNKVVAHSMQDAQDLALSWGEDKYGPRLVEIKVERSKGEIIADR